MTVRLLTIRHIVTAELVLCCASPDCSTDYALNIITGRNYTHRRRVSAACSARSVNSTPTHSNHEPKTRKSNVQRNEVGGANAARWISTRLAEVAHQRDGGDRPELKGTTEDLACGVRQ